MGNLIQDLEAKWVGKEITYTSGSGKRYKATIDAIPQRPDHKYTDLPTVSLSFRDERNKLIRKERVIPADTSMRGTQVWEQK